MRKMVKKQLKQKTTIKNFIKEKNYEKEQQKRLYDC